MHLEAQYKIGAAGAAGWTRAESNFWLQDHIRRGQRGIESLMLALGKQGLIDLDWTAARHGEVRQLDVFHHSGRAWGAQCPKDCCRCKDAMLGCQLICLWQAR